MSKSLRLPRKSTHEGYATKRRNQNLTKNSRRKKDVPTNSRSETLKQLQLYCSSSVQEFDFEVCPYFCCSTCSSILTLRDKVFVYKLYEYDLETACSGLRTQGVARAGGRGRQVHVHAALGAAHRLHHHPRLGRHRCAPSSPWLTRLTRSQHPNTLSFCCFIHPAYPEG